MVNRSPADARWPVTGTPLRDDMPVTGTLALLLERAFCREASDIHIEPYSPAGYRLRLRVDGLIGREIFKRETCDKCGSTWDKLDLSGTGDSN